MPFWLYFAAFAGKMGPFYTNFTTFTLNMGPLSVLFGGILLHFQGTFASCCLAAGLIANRNFFTEVHSVTTERFYGAARPGEGGHTGTTTTKPRF